MSAGSPISGCKPVCPLDAATGPAPKPACGSPTAARDLMNRSTSSGWIPRRWNVRRGSHQERGCGYAARESRVVADRPAFSYAARLSRGGCLSPSRRWVRCRTRRKTRARITQGGRRSLYVTDERSRLLRRRQRHHVSQPAQIVSADPPGRAADATSRCMLERLPEIGRSTIVVPVAHGQRGVGPDFPGMRRCQ